MSIADGISNGIASGIASGVAGGEVAIDEGVSRPTVDNIISEIDMTDATSYSFSSGVVIESISSVSGINFDNVGSPEYDSTLFGGSGGAKIVNTSQAIRHATTFTASSTQTIIFAIHTKDYAAFGDLFSFALADNSGNTLARLTHSGSADIRYYQNEAGTYTNIQSTGADGDHIIGLRFNDATSCDFFFDSTTASGNFDPKVNYNSQTKIRLGARAAATGIADTAFGYFLHTSDALTDQEMSDYISYIADKTNITVA